MFYADVKVPSPLQQASCRAAGGESGGEESGRKLFLQPSLPASLMTWRRGGDSNPRYGCPYAAFRVRCIQPLCHLSFRVIKNLGDSRLSLILSLKGCP